MTTQNKEGFSAYEEIQDLANKTFPNTDVRVEASIFGNQYLVEFDGRVIEGTSQTVRAELFKILEVTK